VTALADALSAWNGAILCVSHDRYLIRRVVEGEKDEGTDSDDGEEDEEDDTRRIIVYLLKGGLLKGLEKGVLEFEESLEKRVEKLMATWFE
jgi:hypothetical protein